MSADGSDPCVSRSRAARLVDLAEGTPGMVDGLRDGSVQAMVDFFELVPGVRVDSITVVEIP